MSITRRIYTLALAALLPVALIACGGSSKTTSTSTSAASGATAAPPTAAAPSATGSITVFAASSLTDAFNELATGFKAANPAATVTFMFGGSSGLRTQLEQGAKADVFASADTVQMAAALQSGVVADTGKIFVHNSLIVITPQNNPGKINTLADLANPGLKLVLANTSVPVGNYAHQILGNLEKDPAYGPGFSDKVLKNLVSEESDVKQVVAKVQLGEADVGIVYYTDPTPAVASQLKIIPIPANVNVVADYPIAVTKGAANPTAAQAFIDYVLSPAGQAVLKKYNFQTVS